MEVITSNSNDLFKESEYSDQQKTSQCRNDYYIYAFQPCKRIRHIRIRPHYFISILDTIYPNDSILINKGQILDRNNSFEFYKILNDDKIIVLPFHLANSKPELIEKWRKESLDEENFEQKMNWQINSSCRRELSRIRDLKFLKSELKRNQKRLDSTNYLARIYENKKNDIKLNIDYNQKDSPSCEPLPVFF